MQDTAPGHQSAGGEPLSSGQTLGLLIVLLEGGPAGFFLGNLNLCGSQCRSVGVLDLMVAFRPAVICTACCSVLFFLEKLAGGQYLEQTAHSEPSASFLRRLSLELQFAA